MTIKGCKSIAEYAMRRWMMEQGFMDGRFTLEVNGNDGTVRDRAGDTLALAYNGADKRVYVKA